MLFNSYFYIIKFILAFCSIVYELALAQALSAFLDNTVLRYSVTIGLYLCFMGIGALAAERRKQNPLIKLINTELALTIIGGFSMIVLTLLYSLGLPKILFSLIAHIMIMGIGFFTGFELPLIIEILKTKQKQAANYVMTFDYFGAFVGTICFAVIFYQRMGLFKTSLIVGLLNAVVGVSLFLFDRDLKEEERSSFYRSLYSITFILLMICMGLIFSNRLEYVLSNLYLGIK